MKTTIILLLTVTLIGTTLAAQPQAEQPRREEVEGMMEAYILSKLQDALQLTDEDYGRMVVAQKKLQDTRREYRRARARVLREMQQVLTRSEGAAEELESLLRELDSLRDEYLENERERYGAIDEILDVRQRARYRILETEIQRRLQQLMRRVRGERNEQRRPFR